MPADLVHPDRSFATQLPVTLRIELGTTTLTLDELSGLEVGSLLPFVDALPTSVTISANGKPFARGDLVRLDGQIAVRLTEIT